MPYFAIKTLSCAKGHFDEDDQIKGIDKKTLESWEKAGSIEYREVELDDGEDDEDEDNDEEPEADSEPAGEVDPEAATDPSVKQPTTKRKKPNWGKK